ncbi:Pseudomonalisin precursor [Aquisphaera giovannonii]|uniref:Pseudomonalisin n=1 Tax=Aquisphaera giovannonii TaxID=406548 RepID=A0A5B9W3M5_9BACT|nr:protease pro-enzyme activation domain-containing protein [Aquisphaera giovannonii]QEH34685.1 Pseudomonalisin precursor [Aquisphaera giovannonii]
MQRDSARPATERADRRPRRGNRLRLQVDPLEPRVVLSAAGAINPFALVQGYAGGSGKKIQAAQIRVGRLDFSIPNRPVLLRFDMGAGSPPEAVARLQGVKPLVGAHPGPLVTSQSAIGRQGSRLARLQPGVFDLGLVGKGSSSSAMYQVNISLAGDVDGTYSVTRQDLAQIRALSGTPSSSTNYLPAADVNDDGVINGADLKLAAQNLGASTTLRPVTLQIGQDLVRQSGSDDLYRRITGTTNGAAGVTVSLASTGAAGSPVAVTPDALGRFASLATALGGPDAPFTVQATATDAFGQRAVATQYTYDPVLVPIPGSAAPAYGGAANVGTISPSTPISAEIITRYKPGSGGEAAIQQIAGAPLAQRQYLTQDQFADRFGTSDADLAALTSFARDYGFQVTGANRATRTFDFTTTVGQFEQAIGANIISYDDEAQVTQQGYTGPLYVPRRVADVVDSLFGVETQGIPKPPRPPAGDDTSGHFSSQVAAAYDYPSAPAGQLAGQGVSIGILELGGTFGASQQATVAAYLAAQGIGVTPNIHVVGSSSYQGRSKDDPETEVMLDIEVLASILPAADFTMYFQDNNNGSFVDLVKDASFDPVNHPSILSLSWGGPDIDASRMYIRAMDQAILDASAIGVTLFVAAGDDGSSDKVSTGYTFTDYPASSPYSVAVGGTTLGIKGGAWDGEVAWNETSVTGGFFSYYNSISGGSGGGGVSGMNPTPSYQTNAGITPTSVNPSGVFDVFSGTGRGVPDVSADADPITGYRVWVPSSSGTTNETYLVGGTSAATPLWAALAGLITQNTGKKLGWFTPVIYQVGAGNATNHAFHDITTGDNITSNQQISPYPGTDSGVLLPTYLGYTTTTGFDLVTGWGSPQGSNFLAAIEAMLADQGVQGTSST